MRLRARAAPGRHRLQQVHMVQKGLMALVSVETLGSRYDVRIEAGLIGRAGSLIRETLGDRRLFVIADETVWSHYESRLAEGLQGCDWVALPSPLDEPRKRMSTVERLCSDMHAAGADRGSAVVAFGGGVAGDVAGFVAASYMRGIDFVQVPTTLLAQVDASVGGKTGVNLSSGKNLVGAFHQPRLVLVDPDTLVSLPDREYLAGVQEVVKHGIIRSPELFAYMETRASMVRERAEEAVEKMISESVRIKAAVVRADERESGLRRILNFGHTLGHALEAETGYSTLLHGEAVGFGMIAAARLSELRGRLGSRDRARIEAVVLSYGSFSGLENLDARNIAARIAGDKKAVGGRARFVLADSIGSVSEELEPPAEQVIAATEHALAACGAVESAAV